MPLSFDRALIVEDLDEPRQWLAELLPRALPGVRQVDTAAFEFVLHALDEAVPVWQARAQG